MALCPDGRAAFNHVQRLTTLSVPSVFVVGEKDPFFRPAFARRMAALLKGRLEVLAGVGHFPQLEARALLAAVVRSLPASPSAPQQVS